MLQLYQLYTVYTRFINLLDHQYLLWGWFALSASTPEFAMPVWCLPRHYSTKQQHATGAWVEHPVKGRTERLIFSYAQSMSRLLQFRMDVWIWERYKLPEPWRMLRLIHGSVGLHHFIILLSHKLFPSDYEPSSSAFRILYRQCTCTWVASAWFDASDLFHHRLRWPKKEVQGFRFKYPSKGCWMTKLWLHVIDLYILDLGIRGNHFQMKGDIPNKYTNYIRCTWDWLLRVYTTPRVPPFSLWTLGVCGWQGKSLRASLLELCHCDVKTLRELFNGSKWHNMICVWCTHLCIK